MVYSLQALTLSYYRYYHCPLATHPQEHTWNGTSRFSSLRREGEPWGSVGYRSKRVSERTIHRTGPVSGVLGERLRKPGVALDWMLSGVIL